VSLAGSVRDLQQEIRTTGDRILARYDSGQRQAAYAMAQQELKGRLQPALTQLNREIYRRARESSVRGAYTRLEEILSTQERILLLSVLLTLGGGLVGSWVISRSLARPLSELTQAMSVVGAGHLDHPIASESRDEFGDLARAFAGMTDNLRESRTRLIQSEKLASIGEMSAAVAHGLRNPLASLRAAAQVVRHHPTSPSSAEHLDAIIEEVDRLDRRITHLLSFSRPAPFQRSSESVSRLVQEVVPAFAELLKERRVELHLELPPDLPHVQVDPVQIEQALIEIISNAIDAMPQGGRLGIRASVDGKSEAGRLIIIDISDTGTGIPASVLPSVCEPFFTTRAEGTGLGLSIAKRYIDQNGGHLNIDSRPGSTTISLRLPATDANMREG
jgi:signal transduction histidine kinase